MDTWVSSEINRKGLRQLCQPSLCLEVSTYKGLALQFWQKFAFKINYGAHIYIPGKLWSLSKTNYQSKKILFTMTKTLSTKRPSHSMLSLIHG